MSKIKAKKSKKVSGKKIENQKRELFCYLYASGKSLEHFGNATKSYSTAYGFEDRILLAEIELVRIPYSKEKERKEKRAEIGSMNNVCKSNGNRLLTYADIVKRCDELLSKLFDSDHMDNELAWTATQRKDLASKTAAIREYNRVKNRVDEKPVQNNNFVYAWATDENLEKGSKLENNKKK